jgi:hypothetical protein
MKVTHIERPTLIHIAPYSPGWSGRLNPRTQEGIGTPAHQQQHISAVAALALAQWNVPEEDLTRTIHKPHAWNRKP